MCFLGPHNPGTFDSFNKIYLAGDHGSHFSCLKIMINESSTYRLYNKELELLFFPSYHGHASSWIICRLFLYCLALPCFALYSILHCPAFVWCCLVAAVLFSSCTVM